MAERGRDLDPVAEPGGADAGGMLERQLSSSAITMARYDPATQRMTIKFTGGGEYDYDNVPAAAYHELCDCDSAGAFYAAHIRGKYPSTNDPRTEGYQMTPRPKKARPTSSSHRLIPASEARAVR